MNAFLRSKTVLPLIFWCVLFVTTLFFLYRYRNDQQIDFAPLYTVGHMWKNGKTAGYYDFTLKKENHAFILNSSPAFDAYAASIGFSDKSPVQAFLYFPAFIPLFSLFTVFPYNVAAKIMMAMSSVIMVFLLKNIIDTEKYPVAPLVFLFFTVVLMVSPTMHWAIKTGQITPLLLWGTFFSYKLQQKGRSFAAGSLLAVVAWIKFFPALLIIFSLCVGTIKLLFRLFWEFF